MKKPEG